LQDITYGQKFPIEMYNYSDGMSGVFILIRIKNARCLNEAGLFFAHVTTPGGNVSQGHKGKHNDGVRIIVGELCYESRFLHPACSSKPTAEVNSIFYGLEQGQVR